MNDSSIKMWLVVWMMWLVWGGESRAATEVKYPADAPVWNVRSYGALGNGTADDTLAFREAISAALSQGSLYGAQPIIYVPNGTYKLTDQLQAKVLNSTKWNGWRSGFWIQGESRAGAVLKLANNAVGYGSSTAPKAVLMTGSENPNDATLGTGNQAFRHYIRNLTIDVGSGNPGAIGIDYLVSNRGGIFDVTVRSGDVAGVGKTGISMNRAWPGPAMIKDVSIVGFDTAMELSSGTGSLTNGHYQYGITVENLTLQNQRVRGINMPRNTLHVRGLTSQNTVPVISMQHQASHLTLVDAVLSGGGAGNAAVINKGKVLLRNLSSSGYGTVVSDQTGNNRPVAGGSGVREVEKYVSHGPYKKFADAVDGSVGLPVLETPDYNTLDLSKWKNVLSTGATVSNGSGDTVDDDQPGIQAAIDSGAEIVYLPRGTYAVSSPIVVRGNVRKLIGLHAAILLRSNFPAGQPMIRFDGGTPTFCVLQTIRANGMIEHNSAKDLVMKSFESGPYYNTNNGTGRVFGEDYKIQDEIEIARNRMLIKFGQLAWFRQLNIEFAKNPVAFCGRRGTARFGC
ncbi:MAG: hypothetical protein HC904_02410 [Blastochloris sp.]|nr:hypothetical protein [Blastochloris sp.]